MDGDQDVVIAGEVDLEVEIARGVALDEGLRRDRRDDGSAGDFFGGREVFLHECGREGENAGDVVEAIAGIVGREIGGGVEVGGEEIADGGVVLVAVEAAGGEASPCGWRLQGAGIGQIG